jgi:class 3 adenylate cyclase
MGQVVTGGRLEVTALGDPVNEAARIQESARDGSILASKAVLERLEAGDARDLDLCTDRLATTCSPSSAAPPTRPGATRATSR